MRSCRDYIEATDEDIRRFQLCQQNGTTTDQVLYHLMQHIFIKLGQ